MVFTVVGALVVVVCVVFTVIVLKVVVLVISVIGDDDVLESIFVLLSVSSEVIASSSVEVGN